MMINCGSYRFDAVPTGQIIGSKFNTAYTTLEDYLNGGTGDKKLVYRTAIINLYLIIQCLKVKNMLDLVTIFVYRQRIPNAK
jgi:hypothetical protein